jgi:hypothetical protein
MGARRIRRDQRQADMAESRILNGERKKLERVRRERLLVELLEKGKPPYTPTIISWLSHKLDKPASRITTDDVAAVIAAGKAAPAK